MKEFFIAAIRLYRRFVSPALPNCCRYYPSCSEYAVWQFKNNNIFLASFSVCMRILRCNQFFRGGIDYPIVRKKFGRLLIARAKILGINFWFVPYKDDKFYVIKTLDSLKGKF